MIYNLKESTKLILEKAAPLSIATLGLCLLSVDSSLAASFSLKQTFFNPTPDSGDSFGHSVAISGNNVLIGTPGDNENGLKGGAAYLFDAATGNLLHSFPNPNPEGGFRFFGGVDLFGESVAISGNNILIGAPFDGNESLPDGSAYLFDAVTGKLLHRFLNPVPNPRNFGDNFGRSVAVSGNNVLIGATTVGVNIGAAFLFDAATGNLLQTFPNPTPRLGDGFGGSVAVSGNNVLIGEFADNEGAPNSGVVHLYDAVTGNLLHTFLNPTPAENDYFGTSIAISDNNILISAPGDNTGGINSGAAYLFDTATGNLLQTFLNPTPNNNDLFGTSTSLSGKNVLISAAGDDAGGSNTGAAYLFDTATGNLLQTFLNPNPNISNIRVGILDNRGESVAVSGDKVLIGEFRQNVVAPSSGIAYLYQSTAVVPEPTSTLGLLVLGVLGVGSLLKKPTQAND